MIKVFTFSQTPQLLHTFETFTNPNGLCVLCSHSTSSNLGYLSRKLGHVCIVDLANTEKSPIEFVAHEASISCMSLSSDGCKIATSSTKVRKIYFQLFKMFRVETLKTYRKNLKTIKDMKNKLERLN